MLKNYANDNYDKIITLKSRFLLKRVYIRVNSKPFTKLIPIRINALKLIRAKL